MNMNINPMQFIQQLTQLKSQGGDPNQMIQQLMNSGKVTQSMYDAAVRQAQQMQRMPQFMQMFTPGGRR